MNTDGTATTYGGGFVSEASSPYGAGAPPPQQQPAHTSSSRSEFIAPPSATAASTMAGSSAAAAGMPPGANGSIPPHTMQQHHQQQLYSNYSAAANLPQNNPLQHASRARISPSIEERQAEGDDDEAAVPAPFTAQDEKAELATLTIKEIYDAEADVRGMSAAFVNMSLSSSASEPAASVAGRDPCNHSAAATASASASASSSVSASPSGPAAVCGPGLPSTSSLLPTDTTLSRTAAGSAPPAPTAEERSLYLLDNELLRIPLHQKVSYCTALLKCPDQISQRIKLAYLRRDGLDAQMAARRIVKYWEVRLSVFGSDRCYLPMTLDGAMRDDADVMIKHYNLLPWAVTVLPVKDTAGRAVVYVKGNALEREHFSVDRLMRVHWYTLDTVASSPDVCKHGFVNVVNGNNVNEGRHFLPRFFRLIQQLLWEILPTKVKSTHLCHPSKINYYIIQPVVRTMLGKELRLRQRVHYGTTQKVLNELALYSFPAERLPQDIGGDLVLDFEQWLRERAQIEGSSYFDDGAGAAQDTLMSVQQGLPLPTDTPSSNENVSEVRGAAAAAGVSTATASKGAIDTSAGVPGKTSKKRKGKRQKTNNRKGRSGRKSDPRMARAVEIRLAEPDIPLQDALTRGGFQFRLRENFDFVGEGTDKDLFDNDGIALSQRKNNLCRRLRVEKEKMKEEESGAEDDNDNSDNGDDLKDFMECEESGANGTRGSMSDMSGFSSGLSSTVSIDEAIQKEETVPVVSSTAVTAILADTRIHDSTHVSSKSTAGSSESTARHERRDSFDEAIMEIPGLGGVDFDSLMEGAHKL